MDSSPQGTNGCFEEGATGLGLGMGGPGSKPPTCFLRDGGRKPGLKGRGYGTNC